MNYLVSTIQHNALVNKNLLRNMLLFADNHKVERIYLYVMPGKNKDETLLPVFEDERIELLYLGKEGKKLNNNLKLHDTAILASQINPLTGFQTKLHRDFSYILPSPKIRYISLPNTGNHPRFLATTGALTHGNYKMHTAQGRKAALEHEYGFAYIKVRNSRLFNYMPVMAQKNGNFNYNREFYKTGKVIDQQPEALVLGDWHTGEDTCLKTRQVTLKMIEELKPKRVFFHDLFNGKSINHHERENNLSKAEMWKMQTHILEKEVEECRLELNFFADKFPDVQFFVVESNHDIFLNRYIGTENFLEDGQNSVFACKMFVAMMDKRQPAVKTAMEILGDISKNVTFLNEDDELRVAGVCLSQHGHRGVNGARGSGQSYSNYNLRLITGHSHTPAIYPNGMVVGTSTLLKLPYTKGPSSWLNAHAILFASGKYSLLTIIH